MAPLLMRSKVIDHRRQQAVLEQPQYSSLHCALYPCESIGQDRKDQIM